MRRRQPREPRSERPAYYEQETTEQNQGRGDRPTKFRRQQNDGRSDRLAVVGVVATVWQGVGDNESTDLATVQQGAGQTNSEF